MNSLKSTMLIATLVVFCCVGSSLSRTVQEEISSEEWAKLFPLATTTATEYEYDIIPIHSSKIQKRDVDVKKGKHIRIKAFGEHIKLWLNPIDGVLAGTSTPIYKIYEHFDIQDVTNLMQDNIMFFYENIPEATTMMINETPDGLTELNGIIGARNMYVRPIPPHYMKRYKKSINVNETEFEDHSYHIAFKLPGGQDQHLKDIRTQAVAKALRSKRSLPETLYVETLLILDYPWYMKWDSDVQVMAYILSFWNAVDLRYRSLENPKVRLNIAAIMIAGDGRALDYMNNHLEYEPYDLVVDDAHSDSFRWLARLQKYFNLNYDVAVTMTSDIFVAYKNGKLRRGPIGVAFRGGICSTVKRREWHGRLEEIVEKSSIVHDDGTYKTIMTAAHELGHILGALHDGAKNGSLCTMEDGYIMSPSDSFALKSNNSADWSPCSLQDFQKRFDNDVSCLYNVPKVGVPYTPILPGRLYTANEQCRKIFGTEAAFIDETSCRELVCVSSYNRYKYDSYAGAADGTRCGYEKICLHSRCIRESDITF